LSIFKVEQYVCKVCGFNIIGYHPDRCPFCGATSENFITTEDCSKKYEVVSYKVSNKIKRLNSVPSLGLEHAAYSIKIDSSIIWIDCPSTFKADLDRMNKIIFTHHHFLAPQTFIENIILHLFGFTSKILNILLLESIHLIKNSKITLI